MQILISDVSTAWRSGPLAPGDIDTPSLERGQG